jgi:hypothetical protein
MDDEPDFVTWALSPERTIDEAFLAEILVEHALAVWKRSRNIEVPNETWDVKRERYRKRRLNPAHRAVLPEVDVMRAAEVLPTLTELDRLSFGEDRVFRDLSGLRFCPALKKLNIGTQEVLSLDFLRFLPALESVWISDDILEDFSGLAHCKKIKDIHLWIGFPWPDLRALAELPALEEITMHANLPALRGVGCLKNVRRVKLWGVQNGRAPLPDATWLPDMPLLAEATFERMSGLKEIGKFPALVDLTVCGPFKDLSPLAESPAQKLKIYGERYHDVSPLTRMPRLRVLEFNREFPLDYTPLLDAPLLRDVVNLDKHADELELAALNAALGGWDDECLLPVPRTISAPVFRVVDVQIPAEPGFEPREGSGGNSSKPVLCSQAQWIADRLDAALTKWFGEGSWGETRSSEYDAPRFELDVTLHSVEAAERLMEVVDICRKMLATLRDRWVISLTVDPKSQWQRDPDEWKDEVQRELEETISEAEDRAQRRRDYLAYLERLHIFKLRAEQGETPSPEQFAVSEEEENDADTLDAGDNWEEDDHPRWHELYTRADIVEEGVWVYPGLLKAAHRLLCVQFEKPKSFDPKYEED